MTGYFSSQNEEWGGMRNWLDIRSVDNYFDSNLYRGVTWANEDDTSGLASLIKKGVLQAGKVEDSETLSQAWTWIQSLPKRRQFFLGINLQNTHFSYITSPRGTHTHQPSELDFPAIYYKWPSSKRAVVMNRYLNSVQDVDRLIEDFAGRLKAAGIWDDMIFTVVGDNGEAFYEHGFGNHSGPLYEEVAHTIAMIKPHTRSKHRPEVINRPVSHLDVSATIVDLAGISLPPSFQGRPVMSQECRNRPIFSFANALVNQVSVVDGDLKLLVSLPPNTRLELFDLREDPGERINLASVRPDEVQRLSASAAQWIGVQHGFYRREYFRTRGYPTHCE